MPFIYMHLISATTGAYMLLCAPAPDPGLPTCTCTCSCAHANACLCASACTCAMQVRGRQGVALHAHRQLHLRRDHARLPAGHAHCMHCAASACTPTARPCPLGRLLGATPYPLWLHMPPFGQLGGYPRAAPPTTTAQGSRRAACRVACPHVVPSSPRDAAIPRVTPAGVLYGAEHGGAVRHARGRRDSRQPLRRRGRGLRRPILPREHGMCTCICTACALYTHCVHTRTICTRWTGGRLAPST